MSEENKNTQGLTKEQEEGLQKFVNITLNKLTEAPRKKLDDNNMRLFCLGQAFGYIAVKRHLDLIGGTFTKDGYNEFLGNALKIDIVSEYLESMLDEYFEELKAKVKDDYNKKLNELKENNKEDK